MRLVFLFSLYDHFMEKIDTRRLKPEVQEELRKQAIRLRLKGMSYREIWEVFGVHHTSACTWHTSHVRDGMKAISMRKRSRKVGACRSLSSEQEKELKDLLIDKTPDQLRLPFVSWTREAVKDFIAEPSIDLPFHLVILES